MNNRIKPSDSFLYSPFIHYESASLSPSLLSGNHPDQLPSALTSLRQQQFQHPPLNWASKCKMDKSKGKTHGRYDQAGRDGESWGPPMPCCPTPHVPPTKPHFPLHPSQPRHCCINPAPALPDMRTLLTTGSKTERTQQGKRMGIVLSTSQLSALGDHFCLSSNWCPLSSVLQWFRTAEDMGI